MKAIAKCYTDSPENTPVGSPDNNSHLEINGLIHRDPQFRGIAPKEDRTTTCSVRPRIPPGPDLHP